MTMIMFMSISKFGYSKTRLTPSGINNLDRFTMLVTYKCVNYIMFNYLFTWADMLN